MGSVKERDEENVSFWYCLWTCKVLSFFIDFLDTEIFLVLISFSVTFTIFWILVICPHRLNTAVLVINHSLLNTIFLSFYLLSFEPRGSERSGWVFLPFVAVFWIYELLPLSFEPSVSFVCHCHFNPLRLSFVIVIATQCVFHFSSSFEPIVSHLPLCFEYNVSCHCLLNPVVFQLSLSFQQVFLVVCYCLFNPVCLSFAIVFSTSLSCRLSMSCEPSVSCRL